MEGAVIHPTSLSPPNNPRNPRNLRTNPSGLVPHPMKIAVARRGFSPSGGAEGYLRRLIQALVTAGHLPVLYGSPGWPQEGEWRPAGAFVPVAGHSPRAYADRLEYLRKRLVSKRGELLFSLERVWRCDVFRAGDGVHRAWLDRRGGRGARWREWFNPKHRQLLTLEAALLGPAGGARAVIANSVLVRGEIQRVYNTPPERIHVVPNGLPAAAFTPAPAALRSATRERLGLAEKDFAILFAGSGWERKGLRFAVAAVDLLPATLRPVLLVAGAGKQPRGNHPRTRFLGPVPAGELRALFEAADVFVLPTLYDPFSNACLEALAAGLPVVTTVDNGFSEILTPGVDGEVVPHASDVDGLASALTAWSDPARRASARGTIRAKAARFTMEENLARTLAVLEGVVVRVR